VREEDGLEVALKVFRSRVTADPTFRRRIAHEARTAAEIRHPNLLPIVDQGEADGEVFLALEYAPGGSLETTLHEQPLSVNRVAQVATDICAGLSALHAAGIVHRDIKPSNIVLRADGSAALTDFGLVKGRNYTALTTAGRVVGTLAYLAPELITGSAATAATDIYGLSCVLFACLAGRPPFESGGSLQMAFAQLRSAPPDIRELRPDVPPAMAAVINDGLSKDPGLRPSSAAIYDLRFSGAAAQGTSDTVAV
jgi:serine/threonine-protein kinase